MKKWVWQHYYASHTHPTEASPGFKHYARKLGRHYAQYAEAGCYYKKKVQWKTLQIQKI